MENIEDKINDSRGDFITRPELLENKRLIEEREKEEEKKLFLSPTQRDSLFSDTLRPDFFGTTIADAYKKLEVASNTTEWIKALFIKKYKELNPSSLDSTILFDKRSVKEVLKEMGLNLSDRQIEVVYLSFSLSEFEDKLKSLYFAISSIEEKLDAIERLYLNGSISKQNYEDLKKELGLQANFLASTIFNESLISEYIFWAAKDWQKKNSKDLDIFYTLIDSLQYLAFFNLKNLYNAKYFDNYLVEKRDKELEKAYLNITKFKNYKRLDIVEFYKENLEKFRYLYNKIYLESYNNLKVKQIKKESSFLGLTMELDPYMPIIYNSIVALSLSNPKTAPLGILCLVKDAYDSFKQENFDEASLSLSLAIFSLIPYIGSVKNLAKLSSILSYPSKIVGGYLIFENFSMLLDMVIDWSKYGIDPKELLASAPVLFFCRCGKKGRRELRLDEFLQRYPPGTKVNIRWVLENELGFKGPSASGRDESTKYKVEGSLKDGTVYGRIQKEKHAIAFIITPQGKIYTYVFNNIDDWHDYLEKLDESKIRTEIRRAEEKGTIEYLEKGKSKHFILYNVDQFLDDFKKLD